MDFLRLIRFALVFATIMGIAMVSTATFVFSNVLYYLEIKMSIKCNYVLFQQASKPAAETQKNGGKAKVPTQGFEEEKDQFPSFQLRVPTQIKMTRLALLDDIEEWNKLCNIEVA